MGEISRGRDGPEGLNEAFPEKPFRPRPDLKDFDKERIRKVVRSRALWSPYTILPVVTGGMIGFAGAVFVSPIVFGVGVVGVVTGLSAGAVNWLVRGRTVGKRYVAELAERIKVYDRWESYEITKECQTAGFEAGAKESLELVQIYEQLRAYLHNRAEPGSIMGLDILKLVEDVYREGQTYLREALECFRLNQSTSVKALKREAREWKAQRDALEDGDPRYESLTTRIEDHGRRLKAYQEREAEIERLLTEANSLESKLAETQDECTRSVGRDLFEELHRGKAKGELEDALEGARRTRERVLGLDQPNPNELVNKYVKES